MKTLTLTEQMAYIHYPDDKYSLNIFFQTGNIDVYLNTITKITSCYEFIKYTAF